MKSINVIWVGVLVLLLPAMLVAQLGTGTVNGIVSDPAGAVVPGAKVVLTHKGTGVQRETSTTAAGSYTFAYVGPGVYDLRVEASGFAAQEFKDLRVEVGRTTTVDAQLKVAPVGEVVEVVGGQALLEVTQSQIQGQITATTVERIPLNGRNFLELAFLVPGNRPGPNYDPTKTNTLEVSTAGQFGRGGNISVDGGDNNDEVVGGTLMNFPQDAIQEFQIATNRYTAEAGRSASGIINIVTKSGTNEYHGSGFFFFRHKDLQGRPATDDRTQPKAPFDRQQYGGSIGGPIRTDKSWWFVSVENRTQDAAIQVGERDFGTQSRVITSAQAPLDDFMILGRADWKAYERHNMHARYAFNRSEEIGAGSPLIVALGGAANRQSSLNRFQSILYNWTFTPSATTVNTFIFHVNAFLNNIPAFSDNAPVTNPPGLGVGPDGPAELIFLDIGLQDGANFRIPQRTRMPRYQARDNFAWTRGKHTIRFGGEWQRAGSDILFDLFGSGSVLLPESFATQDRSGPAGVPDGQLNDHDLPIAVVLKSAAPVRPPTAPRNWSSYLGAYIQDDWRARPNLTLNLGLRWEFDTDIFSEGPLHTPCPEPLNVQPTQPCLWLKTVLGWKATGGFNNFGPRLGFAWDFLNRGRTVLRGGYGIYYDRVVLEVKILEQFIDGRRIALGAHPGSTCNVGGTPASCFAPGAVFDTGTPTLANPFAGPRSVLPGEIGIIVLDNDIAHPYVQQWTLGLQHQFGQNWILSVDGLHNFGTRFLIGRPLTEFRNLPSRPELSINPANGFVIATDPLPPDPSDPTTLNANAITNIEPSAKVWYDGLLASFQKRRTQHGKWSYAFNVNYTWSKTLNYFNDDQINFREFQQIDILFRENNLRLEKGHAPTDERHRLVFFGVFELPYGINVSPIWTLASSVPMDGIVPALFGGARLPLLARNALARDVRTGAQLIAIVNAWNALPGCNAVGPTAGIDPGDFPCNPNVDLTTGLPVPLPTSQINPNAKFGDTLNSLDIRVSRVFTFAERHRVELIGEVFNVANITNIRGFNNRNYSGFNNAITAARFNEPLRVAGGFFGSGGPRAFQLAARYSF